MSRAFEVSGWPNSEYSGWLEKTSVSRSGWKKSCEMLVAVEPSARKTWKWMWTARLEYYPEADLERI